MLFLLFIFSVIGGFTTETPPVSCKDSKDDDTHTQYYHHFLRRGPTSLVFMITGLIPVNNNNNNNNNVNNVNNVNNNIIYYHYNN